MSTHWGPEGDGSAGSGPPGQGWGTGPAGPPPNDPWGAPPLPPPPPRSPDGGQHPGHDPYGGQQQGPGPYGPPPGGYGPPHDPYGSTQQVPYAQQPPPPPPPPPGGGGGPKLRWVLLGALLVASVAALVTVLMILFTGPSSDSGKTVVAERAPDTAAPTTSAPASPTTPRATTSTPSPTPSRSTVSLPSDAVPCPGGQQTAELSRSAAKDGTTSCEFAEEVRLAYLQQSSRSGTVRVQAWSPVTRKNYTMTCTGEAPVRCSGGTDAVVYLY